MLGAFFLVGGLANSLFGGVSQTSSPFDNNADIGSSSASSEGFAPVSIQSGPVIQAMAPTVPGDPVDTPTATPVAVAGTPVPTPVGSVPDRLVIPAINLNAPVVRSTTKNILYDGNTYSQWVAPNEFAAGWQDESAMLGVPGNTVLNGHHNVHGMVFANLVRLQDGDLIQVYSGDKVFNYKVALKLLLPERFQPLDTRLANARWIMPSTDERLTLITCWPIDSNTHRILIVAFPVSANDASLASVVPGSRLSSGIPKLTLTPICGPDTATYNYWSIQNPEAYDAPIEWDAFPKMTPAGVDLVPAHQTLELKTPKLTNSDVIVLYSAGVQITSRTAAQGCK